MAAPTPQETPAESFDPSGITRPDPALLKYYMLSSLLAGPLFPFVLLPMYFKYETLKYRFDESGISMSWGILWRREIHLTYRRIQDIHLTRNIIQRWMGLANVGIQTASGSSGPEMTLEGILQADQLRDYLYTQMRGARGERDPKAAVAQQPDQHFNESGEGDETLTLLREIRDLLRRAASMEADQG
jgi:uncharacterized membrane protein YdbT with pleckstrin-like domain